MTFILCSSYMPCVSEAVTSFLKGITSISLPFVSNKMCASWEPQVWSWDVVALSSFKMETGSSELICLFWSVLFCCLVWVYFFFFLFFLMDVAFVQGSHLVK